MTLYKVRKHFKDDRRTRVVARGLSKHKARKMVQDDQKKNPDAEEYMLTYTKDE